MLRHVYHAPGVTLSQPSLPCTRLKRNTQNVAGRIIPNTNVTCANSLVRPSTPCSGIPLFATNSKHQSRQPPYAEYWHRGLANMKGMFTLLSCAHSRPLNKTITPLTNPSCQPANRTVVGITKYLSRSSHEIHDSKPAHHTKEVTKSSQEYAATRPLKRGTTAPKLSHHHQCLGPEAAFELRTVGRGVLMQTRVIRQSRLSLSRWSHPSNPLTHVLVATGLASGGHQIRIRP